MAATKTVYGRWTIIQGTGTEVTSSLNAEGVGAHETHITQLTSTEFTAIYRKS